MVLFFVLFIIIIIIEYYVRKNDMLVKDKILYWVFTGVTGTFAYWYFWNEYKTSFIELFFGGI